MWKRRLIFNAIFFAGTMIAGFGWMGELRDWPIAISKFLKFGNLAIAGHVLQIIGLFGSLLTPNSEEEVEEERKDFDA